MSAFVAALRTGIAQAHQALDQAGQAGEATLVYRHGARLLDLVDRAITHEVDTTGWVPSDALALARSGS